eukprot:2631376-Pleurochrysis_carterae.AAC.1
MYGGAQTGEAVPRDTVRRKREGRKNGKKRRHQTEEQHRQKAAAKRGKELSLVYRGKRALLQAVSDGSGRFRRKAHLSRWRVPSGAPAPALAPQGRPPAPRQSAAGAHTPAT